MSDTVRSITDIRSEAIGYITDIRTDTISYITDTRNDAIGYITDIIRNDTIGYLTAIRIRVNIKKYLFLFINLFRYKVRVKCVSAPQYVLRHLPVRCYISGFSVGTDLK